MNVIKSVDVKVDELFSDVVKLINPDYPINGELNRGANFINHDECLKMIPTKFNRELDMEVPFHVDAAYDEFLERLKSFILIDFSDFIKMYKGATGREISILQGFMDRWDNIVYSFAKKYRLYDQNLKLLLRKVSEIVHKMQ